MTNVQQIFIPETLTNDGREISHGYSSSQPASQAAQTICAYDAFLKLILPPLRKAVRNAFGNLAKMKNFSKYFIIKFIYNRVLV